MGSGAGSPYLAPLQAGFAVTLYLGLKVPHKWEGRFDVICSGPALRPGVRSMSQLSSIREKEQILQNKLEQT